MPRAEWGRQLPHGEAAALENQLDRLLWAKVGPGFFRIPPTPAQKLRLFRFTATDMGSGEVTRNLEHAWGRDKALCVMCQISESQLMGPEPQLPTSALMGTFWQNKVWV